MGWDNEDEQVCGSCMQIAAVTAAAIAAAAAAITAAAIIAAAATTPCIQPQLSHLQPWSLSLLAA